MFDFLGEHHGSGDHCPNPSYFLQSTIEIEVQDGPKGVKIVRQAEVQLENSYEVKLYLDGGIICQMAKS